MDGRAQKAIADFGRQKFGAKYPDTITEAGLVGLLGAKKIKKSLLNSLKKKMLISIEKHYSKGIVVHGHQECAALSGFNDGRHRDAVRKAVRIVQSLINSSVPVVGVFVKRSKDDLNIWEAEELLV
jgi:hypothetical protein